MALRSWLALTLLASSLALGSAEARTLRWARSIDASSLDPHASNTGPNVLVAQQIYEPLVLRQRDGWMVPALAVSWALVGPNVWEFKLRPNVRFHDGAVFDADDVLFSLERARSEASDMRSLLSSLDKAERVDNLTVRLTTKGTDPLLPNNLTDVFMLDKGWTEANGAVAVQDLRRPGEGFAARHANGTGPYILVDREPGTRTTMRRNDLYWGRGEVPLEISEIVFRPIPDHDARIAALLAGEIDFVQDVPVKDIPRLQAARGIRVNVGPENRSIFLGLNVGARELASSSIRGRNPLADRRVREAFNLAIDREAIHRDVMRGQSVPSGIIVPPSSIGYTKELDRPPPFDVTRARRLMADSGYGSGFSVALHCSNDRYVNDAELCRAIASMLARIDVKVRPEPRPAAQHFAEVRRGELDFYLLGWGVTTFDSEYIFSLLYHTKSDRFGGWNGTGYSDPGVDAQIRALRTEMDHVKRTAAIERLWAKLKAELIYLPLHNQTITHAMRDEFDIPIDVSNQPKMKYVSFRRM